MYETKNDLTSLSDLQEFIVNVTKMSVCEGGPNYITSNEFKNVTPMCAFKDANGHWRHTACKLSVPNGSQCLKCNGLYKVLRQHVIRKQKRGEPSRVRISALLTPTSLSKKIAIRKEAIRKQNQQLKRKEIQLRNCKEKIANLMNEISKVSEESLEEKINTYLKNEKLEPMQVKWIHNYDS